MRLWWLGVLALPFLLAGCAISGEQATATVGETTPAVVLEDVLLTGDLVDGQAAFTLTATAKVSERRGGNLDLLGGRVALTQIGSHELWRVRPQDGGFKLEFDRRGEYSIALQFRAGVESSEGWNRLSFQLPPGPLRRVVLRNLPEDTEFSFAGAADPVRVGDEFVSTLPLSGKVQLGWKESQVEGEGKLFFAAEALSQITVSQGLLRQTTLFDFKVMQGELNQVTLDLVGEGEITRVQGGDVLSWQVEPAVEEEHRRLQVRLNQTQKDTFQLVVQVQQPLGAFPLSADPARLRPAAATRFAGHFRVVNEGAVRLEVVQADGLSQISPEQFPAGQQFQALGLQAGTQMFAYRFSGADYRLRLQADNILPELGVSQVLIYQLGETELSIEAELELDVREAPLRELVLNLPTGYALAQLEASGMSDYFTTVGSEGTTLRIVYGQPVSGRQVVKLRLERNAALEGADWELPQVQVQRAKSVRGHVGVGADPGFRLTPSVTEGLSDIATAYFPKKSAGLQHAFRLSEPDWRASVTVERLAQSIQADSFHLFSVGEGIAYGSSVINYLVAGAPITAFRVELSDEYYNVEFTGREIRNWQQVTNGYVVHLHTPVAGAYTLLATYERPFRAQGETLGFSGALASDAQSEQGHTLVISDYQFQVIPVEVSENLLVLEPGEVPPEYRLFFDAPVLAAYRYTTRPFDLSLDLRPLDLGETLNQVVDRAALATRISAEGQVITDAQYFVKSKGAPWFRVTIPAGLRLWSTTVDGQAAVPVAEGEQTLIPLGGRVDPDTVQIVEMKLAGRVADPKRFGMSPPLVAAPVLLAEWALRPDPGHRLLYRKGPLTPVDGVRDNSGFQGMVRFFEGRRGFLRSAQLALAVLLAALAAFIWRKTGGPEVYRFSLRHLTGVGLGLLAGCAAVGLLLQLTGEARGAVTTDPVGLRFLIPVQQAGAAPQLEVGSVEIEKAWTAVGLAAWPAVVGFFIWLAVLVRWEGVSRRVGIAVAWVFMVWGVLRLPQGAPGLFLLLLGYVVLHVLVPGWRNLGSFPRRPKPDVASAPAAVSLLLLSGLIAGSVSGVSAEETNSLATVVADSLEQQIRVEEGFVLATATARWKAEPDEVLPVLTEPAVLTRLDYAHEGLQQVNYVQDGRRVVGIQARRSGVYEVTFEYQLRVSEQKGLAGFQLPTQAALVQRVTLELPELEADLVVPAAVSIDRDLEAPDSVTRATLVLSPVANASVGWKPRSRDTRTEETVFYAEVHQVYVPAAGVLEGLHHLLLRPAQGEIREVVCSVPSGFTIADVTAQGLSTWRFDPDAGALRLNFSPAQARPFAVAVRSQLATGPLPYAQEVGVLEVVGAAGQVGLVGVATGNEVQLDNAEGVPFSPINLEDFPAAAMQSLKAQTPGLTVRRAFRYGEVTGSLLLEAAAVEPDVRVDSQQTLSLGEDRIVLAATLDVAITRAGIFRLSFRLPANLDVESISGDSLSHWTLLKTDDERVITLHLKGKTEGHQQFSVSLSGHGMRQASSWVLPRLALREASKQRGQLVVVPEQGMRLQVTGRNAVTQLDPARSGIRQKGVLAFRLLQDPWEVTLAVEQVDSWVQVMSLQDVLVGEGQVKVTANLQYEIENTGVKNLKVYLPGAADGVRFRGDQVADYLAADDQADADARLWNVKLHRRMLGTYLLQVSYQIPLAGQVNEVALTGVRAADANLQRGFLAVRADGRLQLRIEDPPPTLQAAEWQSIPPRLQKNTPETAAMHTFRLVEANFTLPMTLDRREAVKLLPARVNAVTLTSVVSDDGVMLTKATVAITPGDKRLLGVQLPGQGSFWFAFVNQRGVWPWQGTNGLLIPLEQHSRTDQASVVEFFYTLPTTAARGRTLDLALDGPRFDLPLENVTWNLYLNDRWELKDYSGKFRLREDQRRLGRLLDLQGYFRNESSLKQQQIEEAEQLIDLGNTYLEKGDPRQAQRAFQAAYSMSRHDDAFNEDARVQLHNLKMQQALIGLNNRVAVVAGDAEAPALQLKAARGQEPAYTQEQARQIIDRNTAEENAVQMRLAKRLVQQQEAAVPSPAAIRATVPESGRLITFTQSLLVDDFAPLELEITARAPTSVSDQSRLGILGGLLVLFAMVGVATRRPDRA